MIDQSLLKEMAQAQGFSLSEEALGRFDSYAELLCRENEKYNLTSITDPEGIAEKHFLDSLMLLHYFESENGVSMIDIGSGAGFPGLPLLIARPSLRLTAVDSRKKRVDFIDQVLEACELEAEAVCARAEELGQDADYREQYDIATARAVAPLNILAEYCLPLVKVGGYFLALKGSTDETQEAEHAIEVLGGKTQRIATYRLPCGDARQVIMIKKISQTPTEFPRKNKKIQTKPL